MPPGPRLGASMALDDRAHREEHLADDAGVDVQDACRSHTRKWVIAQAHVGIGTATDRDRTREVRVVDQRRRHRGGRATVREDATPGLLDGEVVEGDQRVAWRPDERQPRLAAGRIDDPRVDAARVSDGLAAAVPGDQPPDLSTVLVS